jgi:uncharacterized protein (TIGR03437 family)
MRALGVWPVVVFILGVMLRAEMNSAQSTPVYTADSIVNAADNQSATLAPNTIATVYGTGLAYGTKALTADDIRGGVLPTALPGTDVRILIGGYPANLYYVSPTQINFLVPANLIPGKTTFRLVIDGLLGPSIPLQLTSASPALFHLDEHNAVTTLGNGTVITPAAPARPGDIVVLYATGLGETTPPVIYSQLPITAASLKQIRDFKVLLDGAAVDSDAVAYAGIAPGFAGLYQINVRLPLGTSANPALRIGIGDALSRPDLRLPVRP